MLIFSIRKKMVTIRKLLDSELEWANRRYIELGFLQSSTEDYIAVAEVDGVKVGLGRLVAVDALTGELGGMYVAPAFRGSKIADKIVAFLLQQSPYQQLFCIPFSRVANIYMRFGFREVLIDVLVPTGVAHKLAWCKNEYPESVSLLLRVAD